MLATRNTAHAAASVGTIGPPEPPPANNGGPRTPPPPRATTARRESPAKGSCAVHPRVQARWDVRGDERKISAEAMVQSRRRGEAPRPLTPITTVSSPLNLGMNLSPRRISASLRGRNRHITLMLHSAGSAISGPDRRRSEDGWGAGLGSATEEAANRPLPAARPPPAASQQVIASRLWTARQLRHREGEQPIRWAALLLTSSPVVRPRPTCPRPRDGRTRRCSGSNPRPAQTSRASASSAILHQHQPAPAPPGPPLRPASAR